MLHKLSGREKKLMILIMIVMIGAAYFTLFFEPLQQKKQILMKKLRSAEIIRINNKGNESDKRMKSKSNHQKIGFSSSSSQPSQLGDMVKDSGMAYNVMITAKKAGTTIQELELGEPMQFSSSPKIVTIPISICAKGSTEKLVKLLGFLEKMFPLGELIEYDMSFLEDCEVETMEAVDSTIRLKIRYFFDGVMK